MGPGKVVLHVEVLVAGVGLRDCRRQDEISRDHTPTCTLIRKVHHLHAMTCLRLGPALILLRTGLSRPMHKALGLHFEPAHARMLTALARRCTASAPQRAGVAVHATALPRWPAACITQDDASS